jgi:hypothetical protein
MGYDVTGCDVTDYDVTGCDVMAYDETDVSSTAANSISFAWCLLA